MIARLGGVILSVVLHAGLIALLLTWSAFDWMRPVFVDLVEDAAAPGSPAAPSSPARSARPAARMAGASRAAAPAAPRSEPVAPAASPAPPPVPAPSPAEPAAPPALAIVPEPATAPVATPAPAPPAGSSMTSAPPDGRGQASEGPVASGPGGGTGPPTRGDADRGSGGGPGAPLALATPGTGGPGAAPEYGSYLRQFRRRVQESLIYPLAARRQGLGGTVELHVWLEATGRVRDVQVARSSSHTVLDDAAVETIRRLGPVPFPESLPRRPLLIRIPLVYELR